MEKKYQQESYKGLYGWLIVAAAVLIGYVCLEERYLFLNSSAHVGLICLVLLDVLFVLILVMDSVYWIVGISYEKAAGAGKSWRRRCEWIHLGLFLTATAGYVLYCYKPELIHVNGSIRYSMVAAALIGAAGYISGQLTGEEE